MLVYPDDVEFDYKLSKIQLHEKVKLKECVYNKSKQTLLYNPYTKFCDSLSTTFDFIYTTNTKIMKISNFIHPERIKDNIRR